MKKSIIIYGFVLAVLALLLNLVNYYYLIRVFTVEFYVVLIALIFTGVGIWGGQKLVVSRVDNEEFALNKKALDALGITKRELEVLELVAAGCSNQEIAEKLYLSIHTVKSHLSSIYGKMNVSGRTKVVKKARSLKLLP